MSAQRWAKAVSLRALREAGGVLAHVIEHFELAIYAVDDEVFATADRCTHGGGRLSQGYLIDELIECPLHQGLFDVRTGAVAGPPCTRPVQTFPVRVEGDDVFIGLPPSEPVAARRNHHVASGIGPTIGFMGVGAIGRPMAERMLAQFPLVVFDVSAAARASFEGRATLVQSASTLAASADVVFACLPTLESYRQAVLAEDGLMAGGRMRHFIHVGTTGPALAREMNAALSARGVSMLDSPVSGGVPRASSGELTVMASGPRDLFGSVEAMIKCYASSIVYLGEAPGLAQTMKLINNMLSAANLAVASELLVMGVKAGLDPHQMLEVLNSGTGQNSATLTKIPNHLLPRTFDYGGRLEVVHKDLAMFVHEADRMGLATPLSELIASTFRTAIAQDGPDRDMTEVIRHMERAAGVEVGP